MPAKRYLKDTTRLRGSDNAISYLSETRGEGRRTDNKGDRIAGKLDKLSRSVFELALDRGRVREARFLALSFFDDSVERIEINTVIFGQRGGSRESLLPRRRAGNQSSIPRGRRRSLVSRPDVFFLLLFSRRPSFRANRAYLLYFRRQRRRQKRKRDGESASTGEKIHG